jgi:alkylation response protein AidB-like acyl-CoA dehydrogenase
MNYDLSEDQLFLKKTLREFTDREVEPIAGQIDREGQLPNDPSKKMGQMGLLGMTIPERYGGGEADHVSAVLVCEQVAYSGTGAWCLTAFNNSIPESIACFGSEGIKEKYLRPLCNGTAYASIQFTEESTGSNPKALVTKAIPDGKFYVINGMKRFSTFGGRDGYSVLYAEDETDRCSAFVIEKNVKGYSMTKKMGVNGWGRNGDRRCLLGEFTGAKRKPPRRQRKGICCAIILDCCRKNRTVQSFRWDGPSGIR